jgi:hypothetical protein
MKLVRFTVQLIAILSFTACSTQYYYFAPASPSTLKIQGVPGAIFLVSEGKHESSIRILPMEVKKIGGRNALLVRYYFENYEGKPWHLDRRLQRVKLNDQTEFLNGNFVVPNPNDDPILEIPSEYSRLVDLLFPLPPEIKKDSEVDGIILDWTLSTVATVIHYNTTFVQTEVDVPVSSNVMPTRGRGRR